MLKVIIFFIKNNYKFSYRNKCHFFRKSLSQKHAKPNEFNENQRNLYALLTTHLLLFNAFIKRNVTISPQKIKVFFSQKFAEPKACEAQ